MTEENTNNQPNLQVTQVDPSTLNPAPYNPRVWSEKERKDLTESIKRW